MANEVPAKLEKFVVLDLSKRVAVPGYAEPAPFWLAPGMFPGVALAVFIPPGVRHCFEVLRCEKPNYVFGILPPDWERRE